MRIPKQAESVSRGPSTLDADERKGIGPEDCTYAGDDYSAGANCCQDDGFLHICSQQDKWAPTTVRC